MILSTGGWFDVLALIGGRASFGCFLSPGHLRGCLADVCFLAGKQTPLAVVGSITLVQPETRAGVSMDTREEEKTKLLAARSKLRWCVPASANGRGQRRQSVDCRLVQHAENDLLLVREVPAFERRARGLRRG